MKYIKNHKYCIEEIAKKYYGCTNVFEFAGYMLEDGTMLNFSQGGYQRDEDHRGIGQFFSNAQGTSAMLKFMRRGNIRCMCNSNGYHFEFIKFPTREQFYILKEAYKITISYNRFIEFNIEKSSKKGKREKIFYDFYEFNEYYENHEKNSF